MLPSGPRLQGKRLFLFSDSLRGCWQSGGIWRLALLRLIYDAGEKLSGGSQANQSPSRSFAYHKLSRLADATNPESGHHGYQYDLAPSLLWSELEFGSFAKDQIQIPRFFCL